MGNETCNIPEEQASIQEIKLDKKNLLIWGETRIQGVDNPELKRLSELIAQQIQRELSNLPTDREINISSVNEVYNPLATFFGISEELINIEMTFLEDTIINKLSELGIEAEINLGYAKKPNMMAKNEDTEIILRTQFVEDADSLIRGKINGKPQHEKGSIKVFARRVPQEETTKPRVLARKAVKTVLDVVNLRW